MYRPIILTLSLLASDTARAPVLPPPEAEAGALVRVFKAKRRLELWDGDKKTHTFEVSLGGNPVGDKQQQGDLRTPEGVFYIAYRKPNSSFHRFMGLSYPMPRHFERALKAGRVEKALFKKAQRAAKKKRPTPQLTPLGGYVGLHGGGVGGDWTLGCIALENKDMDVLFATLKVGDRVEVYP